MKSIRMFLAVLAVTGALLTGCGDNDNGGDADTNNTNVGAELDTGASAVGGAVQGAGQEVKDESIEKAVEAALVAKEGFGGVTVESEPDGVIVLNGSVASENEKAAAQVTAENTAGVKQVKNNLTVSAAP